MGLTELKSRAVFLLQAPGEFILCLFQLLQVVYTPWLLSPVITSPFLTDP